MIALGIILSMDQSNDNTSRRNSYVMLAIMFAVLKIMRMIPTSSIELENLLWDMFAIGLNPLISF